MSYQRILIWISDTERSLLRADRAFMRRYYARNKTAIFLVRGDEGRQFAYDKLAVQAGAYLT